MQDVQRAAPRQPTPAKQSRPLPADAPDWSAIPYDVLCPLCEYNLRGLIESRCPECGYRFDWPEVLNPNRQPHPYLFEHHPKHNLWSYRQTVNGAGRPKRFWTSLHPTQSSRPWRLLVYAMIGLWLLVAVGLCFACIPAIVDIQRMMTQSSLRPAPWSTIGQMLASGLARRRFSSAVLLVTLIPACWTLLSLGTLMILQFSLRRGKLRNIHLVRSAIYAADPGAWARVLILLWMVLVLLLMIDTPIVLVDYLTKWVGRDWGIMQALGLCAVWTTWRLRQACRYYLRFTWPTATAVLTQTVVLLTILLMLLLWDHRLVLNMMGAYGLWSH